MSEDYGIKISKKGIDVKTALPKELIYSSQFDTCKIKKTGTLILDLPSETLDVTNGSVSREAKIPHGCNYIPLFLPRISGIVAYTDNQVTNGVSYTVNDLEDNDIPIYGYGGMVLELVDVLVDSTDLILRVTRESFANPVLFGQRTATLFYTIFHNKVDEEMNLLI